LDQAPQPRRQCSGIKPDLVPLAQRTAPQDESQQARIPAGQAGRLESQGAPHRPRRQGGFHPIEGGQRFRGAPVSRQTDSRAGTDIDLDGDPRSVVRAIRHDIIVAAD
jgi:hypothetical protein